MQTLGTRWCDAWPLARNAFLCSISEGKGGISERGKGRCGACLINSVTFCFASESLVCLVCLVCLFCLSLSFLSVLLSCLSFLREKQCFSEGKKKNPLSGKEEEEKRAETKNPPLNVQWVHVHVLGHPLDVERRVPRLRTRCSRNRFTRGQLLPICRHHGGVCASLFYGEGVVLLCGGTLELETSPPHPRTAYMPGHATAGGCGASRRVHGGWCCKSRARWASSSTARAISVGPLFEMAFSPPTA